MNFPSAFADIALAMSEHFGGPFHAAEAQWPGLAEYDSGGSIIVPATPINKSCSAQVDAATEAMRRAEGFVDTDVRILILAATLDGAMDTSATIEVREGPHAGAWMIQSVIRDPMGVYWECRGRRA